MHNAQQLKIPGKLKWHWGYREKKQMVFAKDKSKEKNYIYSPMFNEVKDCRLLHFPPERERNETWSVLCARYLQDSLSLSLIYCVFCWKILRFKFLGPNKGLIPKSRREAVLLEWMLMERLNRLWNAASFESKKCSSSNDRRSWMQDIVTCF